MSIKERLNQEIIEIRNTIESSELIDNSNISIFINISKDINNFKLYLPLIGSFNSGKSSILNTLLESQELLSTDIIPQTAIATEIIYGNNERVEACNFNDDNIDIFNNLEDIKPNDIEKYGYLKVYKNIKFLKNNSDIIFVDMPGLDSNIDRHNEQILNYTQKDGIGFIAVIDIDDGGIKNSTLSFIDEINSYNLDFFIIINKIDKRISSEIKEIENSISSQLLKYNNIFVGKVSTFDDDMDDFKSILTQIDKDKYIKAIFINKILLNINIIQQDLIVRKYALNMDTNEIDKKIEKFDNGIYEFDKNLKREKISIENKFSTNTINNILNDVHQTLNINIDRLLNSSETSQESFKSTINEIIRPIIIQSINQNMQQEFDITLKNLENISSDIFDDISSFISKSDMAIEVISTTIKSSSILLNIPALTSLIKFLGTKLNPILAVISTLVSIASIFMGKSKEQQEREAYEQKRDNIKNNIIPQIIMELKPTLNDALSNIKDEFFKELENSIEKQKNELIASLNMAKDEKEKYKDEIKSKIEEFEYLIKKLKNLYSKIKG